MIWTEQVLKSNEKTLNIMDDFVDNKDIIEFCKLRTLQDISVSLALIADVMMCNIEIKGDFENENE